MKIIKKYFELNAQQEEQFKQLLPLYKNWNAKINVISRKNIDQLYAQHVLHSLAIAKVTNFLPDSYILDVGTGGGFPGIPLAILFPKTNFHLVDSVGKKIIVVNAIIDALRLNNVETIHTRAENINKKYDFIVSRAVTKMPDFVKLIKGKIKKNNIHKLKNGILYLKGGDLTDELKTYKNVKIFSISDYFDEKFFITKKVVYLPVKYK